MCSGGPCSNPATEYLCGSNNLSVWMQTSCLYLNSTEGKRMCLSREKLDWGSSKGYEMQGGYKGEKKTLEAWRGEVKASVCWILSRKIGIALSYHWNRCSWNKMERDWVIGNTVLLNRNSNILSSFSLFFFLYFFTLTVPMDQAKPAVCHQLIWNVQGIKVDYFCVPFNFCLL